MLLIKTTISISLAIILLSQTGCLSYMAMEHGRQSVALRKATIKNNQPAIRAIQLGNNGVGIGIDITNWEALTENPLLQLGAAISDAVVLYTGYKGVKDMTDSHNPNYTITVNGNNNNINLSNSPQSKK